MPFTFPLISFSAFRAKVILLFLAKIINFLRELIKRFLFFPNLFIRFIPSLLGIRIKFIYITFIISLALFKYIILLKSFYIFISLRRFLISNSNLLTLNISILIFFFITFLLSFLVIIRKASLILIRHLLILI